MRFIDRTWSSAVDPKVHHSVRRRSYQGHHVGISSFILNPRKCSSYHLSSWGESAGAISVALQMLANGGNTEGLFRGGFMQSGAPIPVGDITRGQKYYDALVKETSCTGSSDTLECLRTVPYAKLKAAINKSPGIFAYQVRVSQDRESRMMLKFY